MVRPESEVNRVSEGLAENNNTLSRSLRSGLWPSTVVSKRSYRNTLDLFQALSNRRNLEVPPLITTDGFKLSERATGRVFGSCVCGDHENVFELLPELEKPTEGSRCVGDVQPVSQIFMITASAS